MATENDISSCVTRLFYIIREGQASDFTDLLDSDDFDYDTTAQAIQRVPGESKPEDWESACVWFLPEVWYRIGGFVETGSDVEQAIRGIAYRWLALPEWGMPSLTDYGRARVISSTSMDRRPTRRADAARPARSTYRRDEGQCTEVSRTISSPIHTTIRAEVGL
jgi:hypothetical protein